MPRTFRSKKEKNTWEISRKTYLVKVVCFTGIVVWNSRYNVVLRVGGRKEEGGKVIDITETRERIGQFITQVYHQKRPHAALGNHLTPMEFQRQTLS